VPNLGLNLEKEGKTKVVLTAKKKISSPRTLIRMAKAREEKEAALDPTNLEYPERPKSETEEVFPDLPEIVNRMDHIKADPEYKAISGSLTQEMRLQKDQRTWGNDLEFYTWETRARVTLTELLKPVMQDLDADRGKLGELDTYC